MSISKTHKMNIRLLAFLTAVLVLAVTGRVSAHYLWIELSAPAKVGQETEVRIYYGEVNEGVREVKGGRLEELQGVVAWLIAPDGSRSALPVTIDSKYFKTTFRPQQEGKYVILATNTVREVVDWSSS